MTTTQLIDAREASAAPYDQLLRRGMAVACLLFSLLSLVSAVLFVLSPGQFAPETYEWLGGNDVEQFGLQWLAWFAGVAAMVGVAQLLKDKVPRLAFWATVFVYIGGLNQVAWSLLLLQRASLNRIPFQTYQTMLLIEQSPVYLWSITVLLWMIGLGMLGVGVWRTAVLPRWVGALLVLGAIAFFLYQGPGGAVAPVLPLIGNLAAGLCFLLAFPVVALRLWRGDAITA